MADRKTYVNAKPARGRHYVRRGLAKKKGGVGRKIVGKDKRWFKPNVQRVKILTEEGTVKRVYLTAKQIKSGKFQKAPNQKLLAQIRAEKAALKK